MPQAASVRCNIDVENFRIGATADVSMPQAASVRCNCVRESATRHSDRCFDAASSISSLQQFILRGGLAYDYVSMPQAASVRCNYTRSRQSSSGCFDAASSISSLQREELVANGTSMFGFDAASSISSLQLFGTCNPQFTDPAVSMPQAASVRCNRD